MSSGFNRVRSEDAATEPASEPDAQGQAPRHFTRDLVHHPVYRADIDGLRALAIIPVVMFHAFPNLLPGGFVGVDIFFVISGYLISGIIFKGLQRGSFTFSGFYANRIKRIFPALLLVLSACFVFGWYFLLPDEFALLGKHILGGAAYVENLVLRKEAGYFDIRSFLKPLMHLWSLGIEEQFYLTYPILLWAIWRLRCNVLAILAPLILISFSLNVWQLRIDPVSAFFLPQTRFWELWVGGVLAALNMFGQDVGHGVTGGWAGTASHFFRGELTGRPVTTVPNVSSIAGMGLIAAAVLLVREHAFPGWWALLPVGGASLLILAGPEAWINRNVLSNNAAVFVGLISYPLYLWHWPILSFARILHQDALSPDVRIAGVVLSFVLAWATWRFVESPIRFGSRTWTKTATLALISLAVAAAGYTTYRHEGFVHRFRNLSGDFGWAQTDTYTTADCRRMVGAVRMDYCRSSGTNAPDVLLIGDSHAGSLYRGLAAAYAQHATTLMNLGQPGCVPFYDTESYLMGMRRVRDCRPIVNRMLDFASSSPTVRTIIISVRGPKYMFGKDFGESANMPAEVIAWDGAPKNSGQGEIFAAAFKNTVSRLYATGKKVVLFVDWPEMGFDPISCLPRPVPLFSKVRPLCGISRSEVDTRNRAYRDVISGMKKEFSGLSVFDPIPYLCDSSACYAMRDGHLLYRDDNHLSAVGSAYLSGKFLEEQLAEGP